MNNAITMRDHAFADLEQELDSTRRLLATLPDEHFGWKPHEKSWALGELATHVTNLVRWQLAILQHDEFDMAATPPPRGSLPGRDALLAEFDASAAALRGAYADASEAALMTDWTFRFGEKVMFQRPRVVALRMFGLSHLIHHRGQLSIYLRLLDVPVPGMYGPSADEG